MNWQDVLDILTHKVKEDGLFNELSKHSAENEYIAILLKSGCKDKLLQWIDSVVHGTAWKKCALRAKSLKELGNTYFYEKKYDKSLITYTKCIQNAPVTSEELSLAFANRSAAFFHLGMYEECLKDVSTAFEKQYPVSRQFKLYQRQGDCFLQLNCYKKAVTSFELAQSSLEKVMDMQVSKRSALCKSIKAALSTAAILANSNKEDSPQSANSWCLPVPLDGENESLWGAAKAIGVRGDEKKGRCVTANREIATGDVLFVEKPFAFVVLPDFYWQRCHHCCKELKFSIPCWECVSPLYCSEACRKSSWEQYHKWECHGGLNVAHSVGIAHLSLRILLKAGTLEHHWLFKELVCSGQIIPSDMSSYSSVYDLMTHLQDLIPEDRIAYALTATCLMLYLRHYTDYFTSYGNRDNEKSTAMSDDEILIGGVIFHHITQLVCNAHAIVDLNQSSSERNESVLEERQVRIATAIYPSASMMNHSCNSNIINSFCDQYLIVKASRNIANGEEVFNCYGPSFRTMFRDARREILKSQYCFECTCEECSKENDIDFMLQFTALVCKSCKGPLITSDYKSSTEKLIACKLKGETIQDMVCNDCGLFHNGSEIMCTVLKAHDLYEKGRVFMENGNTKAALKCFLECSDVQVECLYKSHEDRRACLNNIAKCYALLENFSLSSEFLLKSLPAIEEQFGITSLELANEFQKLTDVMICDLNIVKYKKKIFLKKHELAMKYVSRAKEILLLYYGEWNSSLQDILLKENLLKSMTAT